MLKQLRFKFVLINMCIVTFLLFAILGLVFYFTSASLEAESIRMLQGIAVQPFQLGIPSEPAEDVRLPFFTLQLSPYGELIATGGGYYDLSNDDFLDSLIAQAFSSPRQLGVIEEYNLRYYRVDAPANRYLVFADISSERATLDNLMNHCLLIGGLSFLAFLGGSILLSGWAVRPVERAWKQQRQFIADASHELKTPLSVIMTNAELAQEPCHDERNRQKFLAGILTMSEQMKTLIEQMLAQARADQTDIRTTYQTLNFSKLISDAVLPFEPVFFEAGLQLDTDVESGIEVAGDEDQLRRVLDILLDNAQKYTAGDTVWVSLRRRSKNRCRLAVQDRGKEIPPQAQQDIFKRFYRADAARSRTGSFGLGLSIAESIIMRHRGKIWVESNAGINSFYVELPCK